MVKALANAFFEDGLRLIEIPKKYLDQIPQITSLLSVRGMKFILFIDDLAFDNNEEKYTALKAALEGGIEHKPSNVLLYATSNRRHLVKESFADRKGIYSDNPDDEIRARDSLQEKLSLADRFGITIIFSSPLKKEYLQFVCKMAEEENIDMDQTLLAQKAMQWEMAYNGMSARTARQFINWLKAEKD
jgi:predicted AAA+ superfamily ATPase